MEASFIVQTARHHASGGDLDALVYVTPEGEESNGVTRLYHAAGNNWCSAVEWLVEQGANVHLGRPSDGFTPLQIAASQGHSDAAVLLLDAGARVEDRDSYGWTALHFAAQHNHPKMCKLLLSRGASLDARCDSGQDPEASARYCGHTTLADFLAAVRAAGGWLPYVNAPRKELLALRQRLPALRERGRAAPSSRVRAHERLFQT